MARLPAIVPILICLFGSRVARAEFGVLLAADNPRHIQAVQLAKVMAKDASIWTRVELEPGSRLALITSARSVDAAPNAEAWLRALDAATRVRVVAPTEPRLNCAVPSNEWPALDSGLPEPATLEPLQTTFAASEVELRAWLSDADLPFEPALLSRFTAGALPPYEILSYRSDAALNSTRTLRIAGDTRADALPVVISSVSAALPISFIALSAENVENVGQDLALPTEFPVLYRARERNSDYRDARANWAEQNEGVWLSEAQGSKALFAWTALPRTPSVAPAVLQYFERVPGAEAASCSAQVSAAAARASSLVADYACLDADDVALSVAELGSSDLSLTRLFSSVPPGEVTFRVANGKARDPLVVATDVDTRGCLPVELDPGGIPSLPPANPGRTSGPGVTDPVRAPNDPGRDGTRVYADDGSCNLVIGGRSDDSCSGDAQPSESSEASDSCSGDSSPSGTDDASSDRDGCGNSQYDGDTCSGNSAKSDSSRSDSASSALVAGGSRKPRPHPVKLSLLTLLAAAMALPLRRARGSR